MINIVSLQDKNVVTAFNSLHQGEQILHLFFFLIRICNLKLGAVFSLSVSIDGMWLGSGSEDKSIALINLTNNEVAHHFEDLHSGKLSF